MTHCSRYLSADRRVFLLTALLLCFATAAQPASLFKRKKKTPATEVKKTAYERALTDHPCESSRGGFISLHKTDGKLLVELPRTSLGRDMLVGATISSVSNPKLGDLGFKNSNLVHVRFVEKDSFVVMQVVNTDLYFDPSKSNAALAARRNYDHLDFFSFPIKARSADKAVLFDASSFLKKTVSSPSSPRRWAPTASILPSKKTSRASLPLRPLRRMPA